MKLFFSHSLPINRTNYLPGTIFVERERERDQRIAILRSEGQEKINTVFKFSFRIKLPFSFHLWSEVGILIWFFSFI
jgi:hypothetical protein